MFSAIFHAVLNPPSVLLSMYVWLKNDPWNSHSIFSADNLGLEARRSCSVNITVELKLCRRNVVEGMK